MSEAKGASLNSYLIVFFGAGIGGALRHGVNVAAARLFGTGFPWGTLGVNIVGGFAMGVLAGWLLAPPRSPRLIEYPALRWPRRR